MSISTPTEGDDKFLSMFFGKGSYFHLSSVNMFSYSNRIVFTGEIFATI
jgi:hypothetical protein